MKKFLRRFGPGVVTGAADDDPSGIATYSQTGAQFGYGQLWTAIFMLPLLVAIQEACARIGAVSGKGLAGVIKENYGRRVLYFSVALFLIANTINIGADIGAMAAAANLILPINFAILTLVFAIITLILQIFVPYKAYAGYLKWLCLTLIAYPITVLMVHEPWWTIIKATFVPHLEFNFQFLFIITGLLGTTITPYLFFWQTSMVVEEERERTAHSPNSGHRVSWRAIRRIRIDNFVGMLISEIVAWAIIVVTATVLHTNGITDIKTSADAARALEPFVQTFPHAGYLAKLIFAIGIIGLGLIAVPIMAGSAAYAVSETFNWQSGLNLKLKNAHKFYGVITLSTIAGLVINFVGIDPIKALVYSAVLNGIVAVPLIFLIGLIAKNENIMGKYKSRRLSKLFLWITFGGMLISVVAMFYTFLKPL
ncbi:MAG TPA: Nramp family divalent metal transporter [Gammaproteobacteria bacterium]|nr:Nramp family divalent metal transporter [Gammaproteobacteria bacterium]